MSPVVVPLAQGRSELIAGFKRPGCGALARTVAARRRTSVSRLLAEQIRESVAAEEQYEAVAARRLALELLERGSTSAGRVGGVTSFLIGRTFLDSNVLIYAHDRHAGGPLSVDSEWRSPRRRRT